MSPRNTEIPTTQSSWGSFSVPKPKPQCAVRTVADNLDTKASRWYGASAEQSDLAVTPEEQARLAEGEKRREEYKRARRELLAWAEIIGKDEEWVDKTFTIHPDGSLTVDGDIEIYEAPMDHLPLGIKKMRGRLSIFTKSLTSLASFPQEIEGDLFIVNCFTPSLQDLPTKNITGDFDLCNTSVDVEGFPDGLHIGGAVKVLSGQEDLAREAERRGYKVERVT